MSRSQMGHGDAERMYDFCVLMGLDPVPWQFYFLSKLEQQSMDEQFRDIVTPPQVGSSLQEKPK